MTELFTLLATHPLQDIEVVLSLLGAVAFVLFLRGFLSGLPQLIHNNMDTDHLKHARARAMWGMMLLWAFFGIWETVRLAVAFFQGVTVPHANGIVVVIILVGIILFVLPYVLTATKALPKANGH